MSSVNSRLLTVDNLNDPSSTVITPNHLVTMKPHQLRALPGEFGDQETYGKLMWKKVQAFANQFWREWKATYLKDITKRQRWEQKDRNMAKGDLVLLIDENQPRNLWKMAIVEEALEGEDGNVRRAKVRPVNCHLNSQGNMTRPSTTLERPIQKLVLFLPVEDNDN